MRLPARASAIVAAYTVNELAEDARAALLRELLAAHARGTRVLIVEPIAKSAGAVVARRGRRSFGRPAGVRTNGDSPPSCPASPGGSIGPPVSTLAS